MSTAAPPPPEASQPEALEPSSAPSALTLRRRPTLSVLMAAVVFLSGIGAILALAVEPKADVNETELEQQLALERTAWSAALRQNPTPLGTEIATGALDATDAITQDERYEDYFVYETTGDDTLFALTLTADAFPPDLLVTTPSGRRIAASGLRLTAHRAEVVDLEGAGRYAITVTSRDPRQSGNYELSLGLPALREVIEPGDRPHEAELGSGPLRAGRYEDHYALEARTSEPVVVQVSSEAFMPRVYLLGPEGEVVEPWRTVEQRTDEDGLKVAALRFKPAWDAPYTIIATSEEPRARGSYTIESESFRTPAIRTDGNGVRGTLGERSWYRAGRYIDPYRFDADADDRVLIEVSSREFAPTITLMRGDREIGTASGGRSARLDETLRSGGQYEIHVSSVDPGQAGDYSITVTRTPAQGPRPQSFTLESRRVGETNRGHDFEVTVRGLDITRLSGGRVRVWVRVEERSLNFEGEWDSFRDRAARAWLSDNTGRRYRAEASETRGGDGETVEPGEGREGRLVFYADADGDAPSRLVLHYPIGTDMRRIVSVPIELRR